MERFRDVAVLGAGVAGSAAAKALADKGWDTLLLDRHSFPRHKVCGEFLSPEAQGTLQALGLWDTVTPLRPSPIDLARLAFERGRPVEIPLPGSAFGISRHALDFALHAAAQASGAEVRTATAVLSVAPREAGYAIETRQGGKVVTHYARAVIAAWGGHRRPELFGNRSGKTGNTAYIGVKSHFQGIPSEPAVELYFFAGGYLGISPVEDGIVNVAALLERNAFHGKATSIPGLLEAAIGQNAKLRQKLARAVPVPGAQAAVAPVGLGRKPVCWDRIPHIGDASFLLPPLCGDGMSMALRSAQRCVFQADRYLRGEISLSRWRSEYICAIRREFGGPLRWGRLLQWLVGVPGMPRMLPAIGRLAPKLAQNTFRATRWKDNGS
ncbi:MULTISPECIES: NAD(P)/FAD-dependent oxidoreductase [Cohnella]|uniref:NAD(P)/FAD-dependent oxidoreductase n=1 Tax=Cohnella TaxID=329857 RepID=UPI0009BC1B8B|nr:MULTISPECIES: FAD-dependent monooxygenase [Cohnella]MBN2983951.1 FAD-dependent monooxygenase [Cohnella algarum]